MRSIYCDHLVAELTACIRTLVYGANIVLLNSPYLAMSPFWSGGYESSYLIVDENIQVL